MMALAPTVSIVVPTFRRPAALRRCVDALLRLRYPTSRMEVVVVDDGDSDETEQGLLPLRGHCDVSLVRTAHLGPSGARNAGIRVARGDLLALTADDCVPDPAWLSALLPSTGSAQGAGGRVVNGLPDNPYCVTTALITDFVGRGPDTAGASSWHGFFTPNNLALPRQGFLDVGGFDERFVEGAGEDRDFGARWLERGFQLAFVSSAVVRHFHPLTARGFWQLHANYGRGTYRYRRYHAGRRGSALRVERARFYLGLLAAPLRNGPPANALRLAALTAIAQGANAYGFCSQARRMHAEGAAEGAPVSRREATS